MFGHQGLNVGSNLDQIPILADEIRILLVEFLLFSCMVFVGVTSPNSVGKHFQTHTFLVK